MKPKASPPLAITMGDASGVGPEIVLRRFADGLLDEATVVYGDASILDAGADLLGLGLRSHVIMHPSGLRSGKLNVVDLGRLDATDLTPGRLNTRAGAAARDYVEAAARDALSGRVAGIVTMPMNKYATRESDPDFVGHTELIAALCGVRDYCPMLATRDVAVTHVSTHVPLSEAIRSVTRPRVRSVIELTHRTLSRFLPRPRIAVCGLNPHASENGLFGTEESEIISPAIEAARRDGIDASGPHPADTVFYQAIHRDRFDAIVCMYHDQGHGPMKLASFESAVNVTIGLPIVRTSVDHGTAFDIAWRGEAFTESLGHALDYAWRLVGAGVFQVATGA
ncbi:MAG: 4-hydroxythreonine-4-phosphate dehydrogenase PdxA [Gammaproteobacteria bacterium]|nr:4-hydroxythreonine-4-phosphate dehydrogenase PdxA [Gammaproteobacteria bacterium]